MLVALRKRILPVAVTFVVALGVVAIAQAAIPDSNGVIHGCYHQNSGDLRVVDKGVACGNNETALSWSQTGPQGLQGPQGQPGPQGPQGPQGTPGISSHAYHDRGSSLLPSDSGVNLAGVHNLPAGSYVVWVSVSVFQAYDHNVVCDLRDANNAVLAIPVGYTGWTASNDGKTTTAMVTALNRPEGSSIVVRCSTQPEASNASAEIVAIKVGGIN